MYALIRTVHAHTVPDMITLHTGKYSRIYYEEFTCI
jgi:hypothetical protein